jgi:hypothetical protein
MKDKFYIYFHINPVKKEVFYVGKGYGNRAYSKKMRSNLWHYTVNKYGYEIHIFKDNLTENEAFALERNYIKKLGRKDLGLGPLINMTDGGDGASGIICSEETKKKMSESHKGKNTWTKGNKASDETKAKMSKSQTGRKASEETKLKLSESHKGIKLSEETKEKISKSNTGKRHTEESKNKMSEARSGDKNHNFGKARSDETKQKISQAKKGKTLSEDTKIKMSESSKGKLHSEETKQKMCGEGNPMFGKKHSEETKQKIREAKLKGKS